jgi:hypothetical protein
MSDQTALKKRNKSQSQHHESDRITCYFNFRKQYNIELHKQFQIGPRVYQTSYPVFLQELFHPRLRVRNVKLTAHLRLVPSL